MPTTRAGTRARTVVWATLGLLATAGGASPPWPRRLAALSWQLMTPRLLRWGLYQAGVENRSGRRPLIIRVTREPFGERVRLWCPPGVSAEDVQDASAILCAACCSAKVRVTRDDLRTDIVNVDVIRSRPVLRIQDDN
jgi:hypothetical protein